MNGRILGLVADGCRGIWGGEGWRVVFWVPLRRTTSQLSISVTGSPPRGINSWVQINAAVRRKHIKSTVKRGPLRPAEGLLQTPGLACVARGWGSQHTSWGWRTFVRLRITDSCSNNAGEWVHLYLLVNTAVVVVIRLEAFYFYSNPNSLATDTGTIVFRDGKISCYLRAKGEKSEAVCRQKPLSESRRGKAELPAP